MTAQLIPTIDQLAPDDHRAEVRLLSAARDQVIFCEPATSRDRAVTKLLSFARDLKTAVAKLEITHDL